MAKFPEADARLFKRKFVCRRCKSTLRTDNLKVIEKAITCRKCNYRSLRPVRKK